MEAAAEGEVTWDQWKIYGKSMDNLWNISEELWNINGSHGDVMEYAASSFIPCLHGIGISAPLTATMTSDDQYPR